jgi:HEAT repeat protein
MVPSALVCLLLLSPGQAGRSGPAEPPGSRGLPESAAALERAFRAGDESARVELLRAISNAGPKVAEKAVPVLIKALSDDSPAVRAGAAAALCQMGPSAPEAIPPLCKCLEDRDTNVRRWAAPAIGLIAAQPEVAVPALRKALRDPDCDKAAKVRLVPHSAAIALGNYGPAAREAYPDLFKIMKTHEDRSLRGLAMGALAKIGANPDQLIPEYLAMLDDPRDEDLRYAAIGCLGTLGEKGKPAAPALLARFKALRDKKGKSFWDDGIQGRTLLTLYLIDADNAEFLALLDEIIRDREYGPEIRDRAAWVASQLGPRARPLLPALAVAFRDEENDNLRNYLMYVLRPHKENAVAALTDAMKTAKGPACVRCIDAITSLGKCAKPAVCFLQERLDDPDPAVRAAAKAAIKKIETAKE